VTNARKNNKRRKILIVDDEERMVRFIRLNLEHDGFLYLKLLMGNKHSNACVMKHPI
jgi:two-component system KDP operon response regulator KdpE